MKTVEVLPYDPRWPGFFDLEAGRLVQELHPDSIHHVGSTSVPELCAKPVIDIVVEKDLAGVDEAIPRLERRGYIAKGEYGIPGRRYFSRPALDMELKIHLHCFCRGSSEVRRHLAFRDYLRTHQPVARHYCELKRQLAAEHAADREAYQAGKAGFIRGIEAAVLMRSVARGSEIKSGGALPERGEV